MNPQPTKIDSYSRFDGGVSDYPKETQRNDYAFGRSVNYRDNPNQLTLLPKTVKESGTIVTALPKDVDRVGTDVYYCDEGGSIYKRTTAGSHSLLRTVSGSHGNGLRYYAEDDFLYYTSDKVIGRYGQISGTPTFVDDFLGSEGGVPLNTHWLDLESGSSQYASRADTASLSITGDLAIEATIKPESLPSVGASMVIASKWDINTNLRSYKFEIYAISGYFGDGSDGALTISSNTTEAPIDSTCTGTSGTTSLTATNASFAAGQILLIHQTQGTGAGTGQRNKIASYTAGTITLDTALNATYASGAQVRVMKQHTDVTINSGITYSAKNWSSGKGGILAFLANGTIGVTGTLNVNGTTATGSGGAQGVGFIGGSVAGAGDTGEGTVGASVVNTTSANGNGGGGGASSSGAGGGGGNGAAGSSGTGTTGGSGGNAVGTADLTTMNFGGGGGAAYENSPTAGGGGSGAGIIFISGATVTVTGTFTANGGGGRAGQAAGDPGGGAGAGGSILIKAQTATLGAALITASGGTGGAGNGAGGTGGNGGVGRIHLDYYTSYTGTTTPTLDVVQDNSLVTTTTYQLRLGLSSNGTAEEFLTKAASLVAAQTNHVAVSWDASASTATFFLDGVSLGTSVGAVTSLNDNASVFGVGADFNSTARNFYDGKIDEVRIWNTERTAAQFLANKSVEIAVNSAGLVAYYQLDNTYDDSTSNANHLTASGTPVFATDVPFSSPTSRVDLDQQLNTSGFTYTTPTTISEAASGRQTFVPAKDPQKSIEVLIAGKGTGAWTLTVHDSLNRVIATKTVTNANLSTGDFEFTFSSVWRPIIGASYHFHLTSTVADGTVTTTTASDLETVDFHTYYQFLVTDTDFHPIEQMLNFIVIGNERYIGKYASDGTYDPHRLTLPSGWRVRCFALWKGFLVIGCWKGTNIYDTDEGMVFLWDGYSPTYNDSFVVPEGGINSMLSTRGILYILAGYHGDMLEYRGGDYAEVKKRIPKMTPEKYIETMPKAMSMWDGLLRWGVGGNSNSSDVERGVYTWGKRKASNSDSLSYDFPLSTGSRATTNIEIGFIYPIDRKLLIGWKDNVSYGVDVVDPTASPFATGTIEKGLADYGRVSKEKKALMVRADFEPLASGESVRVKYRKDRASTWTEGAYETTVDKTFVRLPIPQGNIKELEIACDLATTTTTAPVVIELGVEINPKTSDTMY